MAIDEISESVHRQERPQLRFPSAPLASSSKNVIILGGNCGNQLESSLLLSHVPTFATIRSRSSTPAPEPLWPPLKSARYCKKLQKRASLRKGLSGSKMYLQEGAINHQRLSQALDEIAFADSSVLVSDKTEGSGSGRFWTKKACQEFWDEYLKCDLEVESETKSCISKKMNELSLSHDENDSQVCYRRITSSVRKLLRRSANRLSAFEELERGVLDLVANPLCGLQEFAYGQVMEVGEASVVIKMATPFHRVWLHSICAFHGFPSMSKTVDDERLVMIRLQRRENLIVPRETLVDYLDRL